MAACAWSPCCRPPPRSSTRSGLGDDLVGVTFECDEPPAARADKTVVVGGRDTRGMSPGEIDAYVRGSSPPAPTSTPCTRARWPASTPT